MDIKKIDFKQKKYVFPLMFLPLALLLGYVVSSFTKEKPKPKEHKELSLSLGDSNDSIMSKNDAYDKYFENKGDRTMLGGLDERQDSLQQYGDNLTYAEKRKIDSLKAVADEKSDQLRYGNNNDSYYKKQQQRQQKNDDDRDYKRSQDIIRMLNGKASGNSDDTGKNYGSNNYTDQSRSEKTQENDPVKIMKRQMLVMDSIEKARDPEYQSKLAAEQRLKADKEKMDAFLNSTFNVSKSGINNSFNAFYKEKENSFIKAVIDEDNKGYLGSRIRFRLLEDIFVGNRKISKGSILYGQISGFSMQRVDLTIVSVFTRGDIFPVNLAIYDVDGMKGLYVPQSIFRDMMKEMGSNSVQGTQIEMGNQGFFTSLGSKLFSSTSRSIANLIKTNKAKLKYNSYVFLIDEKQLKDAQNQQKK
ncbi:conjugative transposon protein TraM [Epilithonimonas caeni]|uniref:conjugative transposon protein TraM n=1 Tax=Epilithonimonas caeni TaxID=365343 RepID=UPI000403E7D1|nr:conjugative transposon protein TraM [Epilithonimonas caeni]